MITVSIIKKFLNFLIRNLYVINKNKSDKKSFKKIFKYENQIKAIINKEKSILEFSLDDLLVFCPNILIKIIITNTKRFVKILKEIIDNIIFEKTPAVIYENKNCLKGKLFIIKTYNKIIENLYKKNQRKLIFPIYQIIIIPFRTQRIVSLLSLKAQSIGKFILLEGLVIEVNKVQHLLKKAVYFCKSCQSQIIQSIDSYYFKLLKNCPNKKCNLIKNFKNFYLCFKLSSFKRIQEIRIKNKSTKNINNDYFQLLVVRLNGYLTETCKIGDIIKIGGILLPLSYYNYKPEINEGIFLDSYFLDKSFDRYFGFNEKNIIEKELSNIFTDSEIYEKISSYLDIFIIDQNDFKKALLLSLVGAFSKKSDLNYKCCSILNIFIISENEIVSSNIFKLISILASNYFYNNPLTAYNCLSNESEGFKELKPNYNNKFEIKISENGITCIDNIDLLNKTGLNLILKIIDENKIDSFNKNPGTKFKKATTFIAGSRIKNYKKQTDIEIWGPQIFINFDFIFSLSSFLNSNFDIHLAKYIIGQYKTSENIKNQKIYINLKIIKNLILEAQKGSPFISDEAFSFITYCYISIKTKINESGKNNLTLITINNAIKISKCLARIKFQDRVHIIDIKEAFRLLKTKKKFLSNKKILNKTKTNENRILKIIKKQFTESETQYIYINEIEKKILSEGFTCENLVKCISFYEEINLFKVDIIQGQIFLLN